MDPERLKLVEDIYHEAADLPPEELSRFLADRCGDDAALRGEVESLLSFDSTPANFIDGSAGSFAAEMFAVPEDQIDLTSQSIGHYRIISKIGIGGMGVVYLAQDTKLGRKVAIKFLNKEFSNDESKLKRFVQEAKAASALNHPNILTVFEIGETEETSFIVTEWIDGRTWREHLDETDSSRLKAILDTAVQVAEGLSAAHQAGITHRDIKPENIMVRKDGYAKILDFGLAKLAEEPGFIGSGSEDKTRTAVKTRSGIIMGTVSYMSPEQARGKPTDTRTDIWSLGVVIYEMLTGQLPFRGETMSDTVASILTETPRPLINIISNVPEGLQQIIDRSLAKSTEDRYQTAGELRSDLLSLRRALERSGDIERPTTLREANHLSGVAERGKTATDRAFTNEERQQTLSIEISKIRNRYRTGTIAAIAIVLVSGLGYLGYRYLVPARAIETAFNKTTFEKIPINGNVELTEVSPDKRYLAYVERKNTNETRLVLRQTETGAEKEILPMGVSYVRDIEFSPDGNYFYYAFESMASGVVVDVLRTPLLGGEPEKVVGNILRGFSLSGDGKKIAFIRNDISPFESRVVSRDLQSGQETVLASAKDRDFESLSFSPDGSKIAVLASDNYGDDLYKLNWISGNGGEMRKVSDTAVKQSASLSWLSDGSGLLVSALFPDQKYGQIYKVAFPAGQFTPVTSSTSTFSGVSLAKDGSFIVARQTNKTNGIWEFDLTTRASRQIVPTTKNELKVEDVTTDGRLLIAKTDDRGKNGLWLMNLDGSNEKLLTSFFADNSGPLSQAAITNDQRFCYYVSDNDVWRIMLDGSGKENLTNTPSIAKAFGGVSPDGSYVLFDNVDPWSIQKLDVSTKAVTPVLEMENTSHVVFGVARNTGLMVYTSTNEKTSGSPFFLTRFDGDKLGEPRKFVSVTRSKGFVFSKDGNKVYFTPYSSNPKEINDTEMAETDLATGKTSKLTNFNIEKILNYTISRDGTKLYLVRGNTTDEVVMIKNVQ
ncbi:MAG: protein kinase [Pyrinomonadaceae bacterium]|nr:protein kinase [Pyrinomonadaceae bacterium]MBP9110335.1 protein kinase [Pyrinomonadaceae bacterium]